MYLEEALNKQINAVATLNEKVDLLLKNQQNISNILEKLHDIENQEKIYTVSEAAAKLNVNYFTMSKWVREGKIKSSKPGGKNLVIRKVDLDNFINTKK